ncbi:MAG: HD domain-containing protein [Nitrospinae bacterium]|nr:HD domain-containing protein [Nitrospinota bacterium]MDA1110417.1 HD domain-containing protein [Nitrospinota bacterium]
MNDFFQSNRIICGRYQTALQEKFLPAVTSDSFSDSDKKNPQKFYLEFKKRALEVVTEESKKLLDETLKSNNSCLLLLKRTALVDTIVLAAFQTAVWFHNYLTQKNIDAKEVPVAIVARGGYGREEMYFQSDVDLQIVSKSLLEKSALDLAQGVIKQFEYLFVFQDIFRTASNFCHSDATGMEEVLDPEKLSDFFSMMEHRFVTGDAMVYAEFASSIKTASLMHTGEILKYCFKHKVYYDVQNTVFQQEPNVKEELKRLYWALTLVRIRQNLNSLNQFELLNELLRKDILSVIAYKNMQNALNFLSKVRLLLHGIRGGSHRDIISFEVREKIAEAMGFELKAFYKAYFYHAGLPLKRYSRNLFWESMSFDTQKVSDLTENFALNAEDQIIFNKDPDELSAEIPLWIFEVFAWVAEKNYHLSYPIIRSIEDYLSQTAPSFLISDGNKKAEIQTYFQRIIAGNHFAKALRLLHEFGLLSDYYIPDFKNICGQLQDIYVHKFPTDMHILAALDALNLLEVRVEADEFLINLYHSLKDKTALKLAVVLHDIGKGAKKEHEIEEVVGARMIPGILENLGYAADSKQVKDVAFLVEKHLTMYDLMLLDPEEDDTFEMVWDLVTHDRERLKMLVLLTYADRAGTKMKMSSSQIEQLKMFYQFTLHHKKHEDVPEAVKLDFLQMVRLPKDLRSQLETYNGFLKSKGKFKAEFTFQPGQASDLVVCAKDQKEFLCHISTVLAFNQLSIVEANIQTMKDNAFDVFKVVTSSGNPIDHAEFFLIQKRVLEDLRRIFVDREPIASVFKDRGGVIRQKKHPFKDVKLKVKIIGRTVTVSSHDLIGVIMMETRVFAQLNMEIQRAIVHTYQGTASNTFYMRPQDVEQIVQEKDHFIGMLKRALLPLIESESVLSEEPI